jgi:hypothetical protein
MLKEVEFGDAAFLLDNVMIPCISNLMVNSYANYFCSDLFKKCTRSQRVTILTNVKKYI